MHIGIDISLLRIAQSGVLTYHREMLNALTSEGQNHRFTLLDVLPLNQGKVMPRLDALDAPNARVVRCTGVKRGYLSALPAFREGLAHTLTEPVDRALDGVWARLSIIEMGFALRAALEGVDVFHASDQLPYAPRNAAVVTTIHDLTTRRFPQFHVQENTELHAAKERFAISRANRIIAVSEATRRDIVAELGIPPERISVVYEAADERFRPYDPVSDDAILARYGLRPNQYILSVGAIEPRKNYERLIEAYAHIVALNEETPPLIIAGGNGWMYEAIHAAPARLGIAKRVRFLGRAPDADLPALIAGTRLFVYPSLYEGFGLPPLEALASGVPVVVSNTSSLPEVVGDAGLYCDPASADDIARQILRVLEDDELARQLRRKGPERAAQFAWRRAARETLDVYAEAVAAYRSAVRAGVGG